MKVVDKDGTNKITKDDFYSYDVLFYGFRNDDL